MSVSVTSMEVDDTPFGMTVLTKSLDGWDDAWLVELEQPIRPAIRGYERLESGILRLSEFEKPNVKYLVVSHFEHHEHYSETVVYPAFASGQPRTLDGEPQHIAGGDACTHVDALHDLSHRFAGLECDIEGERCSYAMGSNQLILQEARYDE